LLDDRPGAHSVLVKRWLALMVAGLILAAAGGSALLLSGDGSAAAANDPGSSDSHQAPTDEDGLEEEREGHRGFGPPPWAHSSSTTKDHGPGRAWKGLTPAQRADLMRRLSRDHADGMKAFGDCVQAGRSDCEKPLPPGHAKRR